VLKNLDKRKYISIYIDLWGTDDEKDFIRAYVAGITGSIKGKLDKVIEISRSIFGKLKPTISIEANDNTKVCLELTNSKVEDEAIDEILLSTNKLSKKTKKKVIIVLDEFQQVMSYSSDKLIRKMRSVIQHQKEVSYVFLGSRKHLIQKLFNSPSKPFFKSGRHYPLEVIQKKDWIPYIKRRFKEGNKNIDQENINNILRLTDCHPFYTQHLCHELWEQSFSNLEINQEMIIKALNLVLVREGYTYSEIWSNLSYNQRKVLKYLSKNDNNTQTAYSGETVLNSGVKSTACLNRAYNSLLEKDVVDRIQNQYYIQDRFFKIWITRLP